MQKTQSKEFLKLSKTLEVPFKNPEFAPDGIATIWTGLRDKAVQMSNFHNEEAGVLKAGVISDLTRLRGDIKKHLSDLDKEGVQGSKKVGKKMDKFVRHFSISILQHSNCRAIPLNLWGNGSLSPKQILPPLTLIMNHTSSGDRSVINSIEQ
jgi:hypothetical protein